MTTIITDYTIMRMKSICKIEEVIAIGDMQCTAREMDIKKSPSATVESTQIDPLVIILEGLYHPIWILTMARFTT